MKRITCLPLLFSSLSLSVAAEQPDYFLFHLLTWDSDFNRAYLESDERGRVWHSEIANDAAGSKGLTSDQYFTNGIQIEGVYHLDQPFLYSEFRLYDFMCAYESSDLCTRQPQSDYDLRLVDYGVKFVHNLYTPYEEAGEGVSDQSGYEHIENAQYYDRPYAAWAYLARTLRMQHAAGYTDQEFSIGVVGPAARGRALQEWAHQYPFTGPDPIDGWETQVDNRLAIQYGLVYGRDLIQQSHFLSSTTLGYFLRGTAGTIKNEVGVGLEFSWSWPKRQAEMPFTPLGFDGVVGASSSRLAVYKQKFSDYLELARYVPFEARKRIVALVEQMDELEYRADQNPLDPGLSAQGYRLEEEAQSLIDYINRDMMGSFVRRYRHQSLYTEISVLAGMDYVISNYLIEGDINVPRGADPDSDNQVMREGGKLGVTLNPFVYRLNAGFDVGYRDSFSLGYRYYFRGEETKEQKEPHSYSAIEISAKSDYAWLTLPVLLFTAALFNRENWPE